MSPIPYTLIEPAPQAAYRTIMLSPNGEVLANDPLAARDDDAAVELARARASAFAVELWDGLRFIEHFEPVRRFCQPAVEPFRLARASLVC